MFTLRFLFHSVKLLLSDSNPSLARAGTRMFMLNMCLIVSCINTHATNKMYIPLLMPRHKNILTPLSVKIYLRTLKCDVFSIFR